MGFVFDSTTTVLSLNVVPVLMPFLLDPESVLYQNIKNQVDVEMKRTENGDNFSFSGRFTELVLVNDLIISFLHQIREEITDVLSKKSSVPKSLQKVDFQDKDINDEGVKDSCTSLDMYIVASEYTPVQTNNSRTKIVDKDADAVEVGTKSIQESVTDKSCVGIQNKTKKNNKLAEKSNKSNNARKESDKEARMKQNEDIISMTRKTDMDIETCRSNFGLKKEVFACEMVIGSINRNQDDPASGTAECQFCHYVNTSKYSIARRQLQAHYRRVHLKREPKFNCELCSKKFGTKGDLHLHNLAKHVYEKCEVCGKLILKRSFYVHARRHDPNYNSHRFECDICQTKFTTKISLQIHIKTYHSTEPREMFPCNLCKKVLSTKASLSSHVKSVHSDTKHYCDICGKGLGSSKGLAYHQQLHKELRPQFVCSICSKTFHYKNGLTIHMKIHKDTREHLCSECGKSFTQSGSLKRHFRTHTGERPFSCKLCHDSFNDMSILRRHMILKHKQKR